MFTTETVPDEADRSAVGHARPAGGGPPFSLLADPAWLIATLWRRKGLVLLCGLLGALLAAGASLLLPARYVSTAQLLIDPRDLRVLQTEVAPNALGGDASAITAYLESQARVIASDSIKARVAEQEKLDRDPEFGGDSGPGLFGGLFGGDAAGRAREARLYTLAQLDKAVQVRRGERTFVIDIAVTTRDPAKSARIANALANAYLEDQAAVRDAAARRATDALTGRLEELRGRLRGAEDKVERFKEANRLIGTGGKPVGEEQLSLSNAQLVAAQARVAETKARVDEITRTRASSLEAGAIPEAVASNTMTALRAQLGAALSREADLSASLGARHPALAAAQAQVRDARRQIADELARIARAARSDYDRARDAERQLSGSVTRLTDGQVAASRASVELRELEREVESSRSVYEGFLRRARETGELAGIDTTNARVISQAMPALQRSGTSRRTLVLAGGVVGLGLGGALALALGLAAAARPTRRDEERAEAEDTVAEAATPPMPPMPDAPVAAPAAADVPALAMPLPRPAAPAQGARRAGWRRLPGLGAEPDLPKVLAGAAVPLLATIPGVRHRRWRREREDLDSVFQGKGPLVDVLDKPRSAFTRAIAQLREALDAASDGATPRRILIAGVRPGSGASTIALNLALDAARLDRPALLIDSGLGEAGLTASFAPEAEAGLPEIVSGRVGLVRAALQDEGTGLFFLPRTGPAAGITAMQLSQEVLGAARRFSPVVVDGAVPGTDGLTQRFAEAVDDIVLVLREGQVGRDDLAEAIAALGPFAAKLRGLVVNEA